MVVNLNGNPRESFKFEKGVWQGCPLAPYMLLIVDEVLTHNIKNAVVEGRLRGVIIQGEESKKLFLRASMNPHVWLEVTKSM